MIDARTFEVDEPARLVEALRGPTSMAEVVTRLVTNFRPNAS